MKIIRFHNTKSFSKVILFGGVGGDTHRALPSIVLTKVF